MLQIVAIAIVVRCSGSAMLFVGSVFVAYALWPQMVCFIIFIVIVDLPRVFMIFICMLLSQFDVEHASCRHLLDYNCYFFGTASVCFLVVAINVDALHRFRIDPNCGVRCMLHLRGLYH